MRERGRDRENGDAKLPLQKPTGESMKQRISATAAAADERQRTRQGK
jgi:hypothetical protein